MKAHVLKGSKEEIAKGVARIDGDVREAIVFVDEPRPTSAVQGDGDLFVEMTPYMVDASEVDDSREGIYRRMDDE